MIESMLDEAEPHALGFHPQDKELLGTYLRKEDNILLDV